MEGRLNGLAKCGEGRSTAVILNRGADRRNKGADRRRTPYADLYRLLPSLCVALASCGGKSNEPSAPAPTAPLPTIALAGQEIAVYPLTRVLADPTLGWSDGIQPRRDALDHADSLIAAFLTERAPEVQWVLPDDLRDAARRAPGLLTNPDQMATAILRAEFERVPDPLRGQLRQLNGVAGGRLALIPADLVFVKPFRAVGQPAAPAGRGRADLALVMVDVVTGEARWRTVAHGEGDDPWEALAQALGELMPLGL